MSAAEISDIMYELFGMVIRLAGPVLLISMVVGVMISIIQAATQIHEQTITFVPKLLAIGVFLLVAGGNVMQLLSDFTIRIFNSMLGP